MWPLRKKHRLKRGKFPLGFFESHATKATPAISIFSPTAHACHWYVCSSTIPAVAVSELPRRPAQLTCGLQLARPRPIVEVSADIPEVRNLASTWPTASDRALYRLPPLHLPFAHTHTRHQWAPALPSRPRHTCGRAPARQPSRRICWRACSRAPRLIPPAPKRSNCTCRPAWLTSCAACRPSSWPSSRALRRP